MSIPSITVTPSSAVDAYARVQNGSFDAASPSGGFGDVLARAIEGVAETGHKADAESARAISGHGSVTDVATAVTKAELALQTAVSIRDRMVQAFQDVSRMPI